MGILEFKASKIIDKYEKKMENIIKLGREDEEKFSTFIKKSRKELILNPKLTFLQALEKNKIKLSISSISQNIRDLRQSSYDLFLEQENHFNAYVLKNIADNFSLPNEILSSITKEFFELKIKNYDDFKESFKLYFGSYAGAISPYIYALCLSNTNARRSRSGKTFEQIIYYLYENFGFSYDAQAKIGKSVFSSLRLGKVVDSILPSVDAFKKFRNKCIVGSMKTSLRERWQEVVEETTRSNLPNIYLLTCDNDSSSSKIQQMREHNIILVVFKEVKEKLKDFESVISFEYYFSKEIPSIMEYWHDKSN